jgi:hypothetical protein
MSFESSDAEKLVFNYMIEITLGLAFLVNSMYGTGQASAATTTSADTATSIQKEIVSIPQSSLTDSKAIESYVRSQYADKPLLIDIARCESTFRQFDKNGQVIRGNVNHEDVGVMQINEKYHADEAVKMGINIYTVEGNVAFAKHLYEKYGSQPWGASSPCWGDSSGLARR